MLEVKHVPETARHGRGFLNCGTSGLKKGCFVVSDGKFTNNAGPTGYEGKPGYATNGSQRWSPATQFNTSGLQVGVISKLEFQRESSDLSLDTLVSGESMIVYKAGTFETDQYENTITSATTIGALLYLSANSKLTATAAGQPVAIFWGTKNTTFESAYTATGLVEFELLPNHSIYSKTYA